MRDMRLVRILLIGFVTVAFSAGFAMFSNYSLDWENQTLPRIRNIAQEYEQLKESEMTLNEQLENIAFEKQLVEMQNTALEESKLQIEDEFNKFKSEATQEKLAKIEAIYNSYQAVLSKIDRNQTYSIDTGTYDEKIQNWGLKLLNQELDELQQEVNSSANELDQDYQEYLASLPTPTPTSVPVAAPPAQSVEGYSYQTVSTSRGNFSTYLIKMPLSQVQVKTVTANSSNCTNNCPAKSLADYVAENNAYAGLHGTYFCPPDYASCANKTYSYDFGVYNSNLGKWLNEHALSWNDLGLATFNGNSTTFYHHSKNYPKSGVTAGISNFPTLLSNGSVVVDPGKLSSYQRDVRGPRGAIGVSDSHVYLAIISSATVVDTAYVMQSLGATQSLNLDGGGSSAMWIGGGYKVGPGRSLPNAILLIK